jgi:hypothetical protein
VAFSPSPSLWWYAGGTPTWTSTLSTQLGAPGYGCQQLLISLPLPVVVHDRHLPVFPIVILPLPIFLPLVVVVRVNPRILIILSLSHENERWQWHA